MINYQKIVWNLLLKLAHKRKSNRRLGEDFFNFNNESLIWTEEMAQRLRRAYQEDEDERRDRSPSHCSFNNDYYS